MTGGDVGVVVLAHGDEPLLEECLASVLASVTRDGGFPDLHLVVVDNGARDVAGRVPSSERLTVLSPGRNTGFAGGCNLGAAATAARRLVFLNSDAVLEPHALSALLATLDEPSTGLVCGAVLLRDQPEIVNSVGNPLHFLGLSWSGGFGKPVAAHLEPRAVTCASGALFGVRRETWEQLGGFEPEYFAYHEDADLSLRCWQLGLDVRYCPDAIAWHAYEFSGNSQKMYLLERNRWLLISTVYPARVLAIVMPALLAFEVVMLLRAVAEGWLGAKFRGYSWLLRHAAWLRRRRAAVQRRNRLSPRGFADLLTSRLEPSVLGEVRGLAPANKLFALYWRLALRALPVKTTSSER